MDALSFVASLVESLVWPVTTLAVVYMLRKPLGQVIREIRRLKYRDLEAEFGEAVDDLKADASDVLPASAVTTAEKVGERRLGELADASPNAAVLDAWQEVEQSARALIAASGVDVNYDTDTPFSLIEQTLADKGLVGIRHVKVFGDLRRLRNKVAHARGYQVTSAQARDYVGLALALAAEFARAGDPARQ